MVHYNRASAHSRCAQYDSAIADLNAACDLAKAAKALTLEADILNNRALMHRHRVRAPCGGGGWARAARPHPECTRRATL